MKVTSRRILYCGCCWGGKGGLDLTMAGLINFEDENEVKEFLDNLGVEYSFQCYKEKDPEGNIHRTAALKL